MCEINILFISDFSLPHPVTWNYSTGMKLKEELCASNHRNANATSVSLKKHLFTSYHSGLQTTQEHERQCSFLFHGNDPRLHTDNY